MPSTCFTWHRACGRHPDGDAHRAPRGQPATASVASCAGWELSAATASLILCFYVSLVIPYPGCAGELSWGGDDD